MRDKQVDPPQDLVGTKAREMMRDIVTSAHIGMLVTQHDKFPFDVRPMGVQGVDESGTIWFISASDSDKNRDIERDPRVTLLVQNGDKHQYAQLSGRASIHRERELIEKYWSPLAKTWFDGKDDPRVTLIALKPESGHYWTTTNGKVVTTVRMLLGAAGLDVDEGGKQGELRIRAS
jgi:general stress protein 26